MPRLLDMFTGYLRETRPEELRGSAGTQRLREELLARANIATRPGTVTDVLFVELIVQ
jgi:flagellar FliL protein